MPTVTVTVAPSVTVTVVAGTVVQEVAMPTGATIPIAYDASGSEPAGWLWCDGRAVSRTTYSALFAVVSTAFGAGDGSTTFNLPDLRGRAVIGMGTGDGLTARALADEVGAETHQLTDDESAMPLHSHNTSGHTHVYNAPNIFGTGAEDTGGEFSLIDGFDPLDPDTTASSSPSTLGTLKSLANSAHNNMQPSLAMGWLIKT